MTRVSRETLAFKEEMLALLKKYKVKDESFVLICTSCGSPFVKIHLWNPTAFTRECEDCGYKELYKIKQLGTNLTDLERKL